MRQIRWSEVRATGTRPVAALAVVVALAGLAACAAPATSGNGSTPRDAAPSGSGGAIEAVRWSRAGARERRAGNLDAAERHYGRALQADPDSAAAREGLGLVHLARGNHALAEIALERAVEIDPERPESLAAMGALLDALERHSEARERYARAVEGGGRTPDLLNAIGYSWYLESDLTAATEAFEDALDLDPGFDKARANLALARFRAGDEDGALAAFERIVGEHRALNNVGYLYLVAGDDASARRLLARSRDVAPRGYRRAERNLELVGDAQLRSALGLDAVRARLALTEGRPGGTGTEARVLAESPTAGAGAVVSRPSLVSAPLVPYDGVAAVEVSPGGDRAPGVREAGDRTPLVEGADTVARPFGASGADLERDTTLARIPEAVPAPDPIDPADDEPIEQPGLELVRSVQEALNERGMDAGPVDGSPGGRTVRALRRFKIARRLPVTDDITYRLLDELGVQRP